MGADVIQTLAGTGAGAFSTIVFYPLDLVKVRLEATQGRVSITKCVTTILQNEGWTALYRGLTPSLFGASLSWGLYFTLYDNAKSRHIRISGLGKDEKLAWSYHMMSACEAGTLTTLITNPIWLIKTRLQLQFDKIKQKKNRIPASLTPSGIAPLRALSTTTSSDISNSFRQYSGPIDCFRKIVLEEGFFALWKGVVPGLLLVSHGTIQFVLYEELKELFKKQVAQESASNDQTLSSWHFLFMGSLSKVGASVSTYPLQTIKIRLQAPVLYVTRGRAVDTEQSRSCPRAG